MSHSEDYQQGYEQGVRDTAGDKDNRTIFDRALVQALIVRIPPGEPIEVYDWELEQEPEFCVQFDRMNQFELPEGRNEFSPGFKITVQPYRKVLTANGN